MKKLSLLFLWLILLMITYPTKVWSKDPLSDSSATLKVHAISSADFRLNKLKFYLAKYNSSLLPYAKDIIEHADENNIDWRLVPAISGVESTFCKHIPYNSYNCWGWRNGEHYFKDYSQAIEIVSKTLGKYYVKRGLDTPEEIGPVYAPPSSTWAKNVKFFMNMFEKETSSILLANNL